MEKLESVSFVVNDSFIALPIGGKDSIVCMPESMTLKPDYDKLLDSIVESSCPITIEELVKHTCNNVYTKQELEREIHQHFKSKQCFDLTDTKYYLCCWVTDLTTQQQRFDAIIILLGWKLLNETITLIYFDSNGLRQEFVF